MQWLFEDVSNRSLFDNSPGIHYEDAVRQSCEIRRIVRYQQERESKFLFQIFEELENARLVDRVQSSGRFISQD